VAARTVTQKPSYLSSVDTLRELHWLPIQWRSKFKLASLTSKATHNEVGVTMIIFLAFVFLTIHPVFSGHISLLASYTFLALTLFSVLTPVQPHQPFGIPFLTIHPIHLTLSGTT